MGFRERVLALGRTPERPAADPRLRELADLSVDPDSMDRDEDVDVWRATPKPLRPAPLAHETRGDLAEPDYVCEHCGYSSALARDPWRKDGVPQPRPATPDIGSPETRHGKGPPPPPPEQIETMKYREALGTLADRAEALDHLLVDEPFPPGYYEAARLLWEAIDKAREASGQHGRGLPWVR